MQRTDTRSAEVIDHLEVHEDRLVELVLLASEATEDAFELDDLVDEWMRAESEEHKAPLTTKRQEPSLLGLGLDAPVLSSADQAEAA
jgi:hypothetical protein